ncbi:hypothetical protein ACVTD8_16255 [Vibrio cholerae]|nr:hypothetical protein [Vibrio cholerae]EKF9373233.1 hypothetical protein [Vibrio cholerae]MCU8168326.1 hypothetical protein [Vibrio vulnificus]MCU8172874.1 hypothetical protein [Vibrio vulnificus]MCU8501711.1 hypothetical protein [Vibrio vulnificus]
MTEVIISLLAGLGVPVLAVLFSKIVDLKAARSEKLVIVRSSTGKESNLKVSATADKNAILRLLEEEYQFENSVEKILNKYKSKHKEFDFYKNDYVDFILKQNDKIIALEAKTSSNLPAKEYLDKIRSRHPEVSDLVLLFNSEIPSKYFDEYKGKNNVTFVSAPRNKSLSDKIVNVLNKEFSNS